MTSYRSRSPFASPPAAAPSETDLTWTEPEPEPDYEDDDSYNPHGYKYHETTAERLQIGQIMCWTETDGWLNPPEKVLETYNRHTRCIVLDRSGERDNWSLRAYTRVRYMDTTPVFNDWGEEGL